MACRLKKGDEVRVIAGRDKGKEGEVMQILSRSQRVLVEKVNLVSRHLRQSSEGSGGIIEKEAPIHISNVKYICSKCKQPAAIASKRLESGKNVRACKKCGEILDK